jgi:hypothetical protein
MLCALSSRNRLLPAALINIIYYLAYKASCAYYGTKQYYTPTGTCVRLEIQTAQYAIE